MDPVEILKKIGLKATKPRMQILNFLKEKHKQHKHCSIEEIYQALIAQNSTIGIATVYRVLNQFEKQGIVLRHNFNSNKAMFELNLGKQQGHIICMDCNHIFELQDSEIEKRQIELGNKAGIAVKPSSFYLYGNCKDIEHCDHKDK